MARSMIALLIPFNNARRSLTSSSAHTQALKKRCGREPPKRQTLMFRGDKFTFFHVISSYREMAEVPPEIFSVLLQVNIERAVEVAQRCRGMGFPALNPPSHSSRCSPATRRAPHRTGRPAPHLPFLPRVRGHSTKSHAAPGEVTALARGLFVLTGCIHYSSGKVCKDPAQHPEA